MVIPIFRLTVLVSAVIASAGHVATAADSTQQAAAILQQSGVQGGFVVHLGAASGDLTAALRASAAFQVQGLEADAASVSAARQRLLEAGHYGEVSLLQFSGDALPYIDNMVNLLVVDQQGSVPRDELLRVLVPGGVLMLRQPDGSYEKQVRQRPDNIDEWSHYLHDATGNAVAHDDVVGSPRHLQWVGSPRWSRHHDRMASMSALVSTSGRLFYIMDEGSRIKYRRI